MKHHCILLSAIALTTTACASVPRGPATRLADAGSSTSAALGSQIRSTAKQIAFLDVGNSFDATWDMCQNPNVCRIVEPSSANLEARQRLTKAIELRARAAEALGLAYDALKTEAEYDASADLQGAVQDAVDAANAYSGFIQSAPGAQIISDGGARLAGYAGGLFANQQQRRRLFAGSDAIRTSALLLRDGLRAEAGVYESLQQYIIDSETDARLALLEAGLVSRSDFLAPLISGLGLKPRNDSEATLANSNAASMAMQATMRAQARAEVLRVQGQYQASIAALDALIRAHGEFEQERAVTINDVSRFLTELDAALADPEAEEGTEK